MTAMNLLFGHLIFILYQSCKTDVLNSSVLLFLCRLDLILVFLIIDIAVLGLVFTNLGNAGYLNI